MSLKVDLHICICARLINCHPPTHRALKRFMYSTQTWILAYLTILVRNISSYSMSQVNSFD